MAGMSKIDRQTIRNALAWLNATDAQRAVTDQAMRERYMQDTIKYLLHVLSDHNIEMDSAGEIKRKKSPCHIMALRAVAEATGISVAHIKSKKRLRAIVDARNAAIIIMRRHCALSLQQIGTIMEQHHTTVMHSERVGMQSDDTVRILSRALRILEWKDAILEDMA